MLEILKKIIAIIGGMQEKAWYLSKTQWANIISLVVLALVNFKVINVGLTPEEVNGLAVAIIPVINMILRGWFTKIPLSSSILPDGKVTAELKLEARKQTLNPDFLKDGEK